MCNQYRVQVNTGLLNCTRFDIYANFFLSQESSCNRRLAIHRRESALREAAATSTLSTTVPEVSTSSTTEDSYIYLLESVLRGSSATSTLSTAVFSTTASTTVDNMRKRTAPTPTVSFIDSTTVVFRADTSTRRTPVSTSTSIIKDEQKIPAIIRGVFDDDQPIPSTSRGFSTTIPASSSTSTATATTAAQLLNPTTSSATITENIKMTTFGEDNTSADSDSFDDEGDLEENFYDEVAADTVREDPVVPILVDQHVPDVSIPANETTADVTLTGLENENFLDAATFICRYTPVEKCGILVNGLLYGIVALLH